MKSRIRYKRKIRICCFLILLFGCCISSLYFMMTIENYSKLSFEDNIIYEANSSDFEDFSLDDLQNHFIECLAESEKNYIIPPNPTRTRRTKSLEYNSSDRTKEDYQETKSVFDSFKDVNELIKIANVSVVILDPTILFCMLSSDHQLLLFRRKFNDTKYLNGREVIELGILSEDVAAFIQNFELLLQNGLQLIFIKDTTPNWMRNKNPPAKSETGFTSHILGWYYGRLLHFVVLYERSNYLWHSHLDLQRFQELPPKKEFHFAEHDSAYEKFRFVSLGSVDSSLSHFHVPSNPHFFLFQMDSSKFLECDMSRAANMTSSGQPKQHPSLTVDRFNKRTLIALQEMRAIFGPLLMHYWIWSGTMLGWYRQCDVIPYTTDVDFGVWASELDNLYTLIGLLTDNEHLKIKMRMGLVEHALEFQLNCHNLRVDVFFLYQEKNGTWYAGHKPSEGYFFKYFHPNFTLCSGELLGEKVLVPCETEKVIVAEYGPGWSHPVSSWNYESSIKNRGPNIYWETDLRKTAYKNF